MQQLVINRIIRKLNLKKHPEGGYFSETYRCSKTISLSSDNVIDRNLATNIYFMLKSGQVSKFHRLKSDEIWYHHSGSPLKVYMIDKNCNLQIVNLGDITERECQPQLIIPGGTIFGAEVILPETYSLIGCAVMPGFDFEDFELINKNELGFIIPNNNIL